MAKVNNLKVYGVVDQQPSQRLEMSAFYRQLVSETKKSRRLSATQLPPAKTLHQESQKDPR
jgi:hypothetical protein